MFASGDNGISHMLRPVVVKAFRGSVFLACLAFLCLSAFASSGWQAPTAEELKMTVDPAAPDAAAVYLYREESVDDHLHNHTLYVRLKILTEKAKDLADVEMPIFDRNTYNITNIEGRTIHSDGTIIPFSGKPYDKLIEKTNSAKYTTKVFTLPDVQVGSILEYRYVLRYDDQWVVSPKWYLQQPYFVHKAHYNFVPSTRDVITDSGTTSRLAYMKILPPGKDMVYVPASQTYTLDVENLPALPDEEYSPPMNSVTYRVLFYYTAFNKMEEYWNQQGKRWQKSTDHFADPGKTMQATVAQLVAPGDTQLQKLQKLYAAVMTIENTRFTRQHTAEENKAQGVKVKTAEDIWQQKRGTDDEIAMLFLGLVRAAGMKAYAMAVSERNRTLFLPSYLSWDQLDNTVVIVPVDGKDMFFDPGQRYCPFGKLAWKNTMSGGIRETDNGTAIAETPAPTYADTKVLRTADLTLDEQGKVTGFIRISLTGSAALQWRQRALRTDEVQIKKEFEDALQPQMPAGVQVKTNHFLGLTDFSTVLLVVVDVSGSMGTATGKRIFLPSDIFEANAKPLFVHEKRQSPIDLEYPSDYTDNVQIHLPATLTIESVPHDANIPLEQLALYM